MIRKLKRKFVCLAMAAVLVLLGAMVAGMALLNFQRVTAEADSVLNFLAENKGTFPEFSRSPKKGPPPEFLSAEAPYESRFFSVLLNGDGEAVSVDLSRINAVDREEAVEFTCQALAGEKDRGFLGTYRYLISREQRGSRVTVLDCERSIREWRGALLSSLMMAAVGACAFFAVILFCSGKILKPVAQSYEKQKRFITDAGHEIKTPLAIIKADADVLELELGENEWLEDIQTQISRLSGLTADLVYLSRLEETESTLQLLEFPFSDVVLETAQSFLALAQVQEKTVQFDVPGMISCRGNEKAIRQLIDVLMDNAVKYSPPGGVIRLSVKRTGRFVQMSVSNTTEEPVSDQLLEHLFDRFYRGDPSRSSSRSGYGIGLSVARAIVQAHGGRIKAERPEGCQLMISVLLPM